MRRNRIRSLTLCAAIASKKRTKLLIGSDIFVTPVCVTIQHWFAKEKNWPGFLRRPSPRRGRTAAVGRTTQTASCT